MSFYCRLTFLKLEAFSCRKHISRELLFFESWFFCRRHWVCRCSFTSILVLLLLGSFILVLGGGFFFFFFMLCFFFSTIIIIIIALPVVVYKQDGRSTDVLRHKTEDEIKRECSKENLYEVSRNASKRKSCQCHYPK